MIKTHNIFVVFIVITILFSSCRKEPTACFTTSADEYVLGTVIKFNNCSDDTREYEWDFGDGESETISEPSHKFENSGTYTVTLKALNGKKSNEFSKQIKVGLWKLKTADITFLNDTSFGYRFYMVYDFDKESEYRTSFSNGQEFSNNDGIIFGTSGNYIYADCYRDNFLSSYSLVDRSGNSAKVTINEFKKNSWGGSTDMGAVAEVDLTFNLE